jgi:hypothetical protein
LAPALNKQCNPVEKQHHLDSFIYSAIILRRDDLPEPFKPKIPILAP